MHQAVEGDDDVALLKTGFGGGRALDDVRDARAALVVLGFFFHFMIDTLVELVQAPVLVHA